jgi:hypothetical protein
MMKKRQDLIVAMPKEKDSLAAKFPSLLFSAFLYAK